MGWMFWIKVEQTKSNKTICVYLSLSLYVYVMLEYCIPAGQIDKW